MKFQAFQWYCLKSKFNFKLISNNIRDGEYIRYTGAKTAVAVVDFIFKHLKVPASIEANCELIKEKMADQSIKYLVAYFGS